MYESISVSTFIPWYPYICSLCLCLYFCFVNKDHLYHFARFHIHALIYSVCFSLSDLLHSVWHSLGSSMSLQTTQFLFYGWIIFHWKGGTLNTRIEPCSLCCTPQYCCARSKLEVWNFENGKNLALLPSATWEGDRDSSTNEGCPVNADVQIWAERGPEILPSPETSPCPIPLSWLPRRWRVDLINPHVQSRTKVI